MSYTATGAKAGRGGLTGHQVVPGVVERTAEAGAVEDALVEIAVVMRAGGADGVDLVPGGNDRDSGIVHLPDQNAPVVEVITGEAMSKVHQLAHRLLLNSPGTILPIPGT